MPSSNQNDQRLRKELLKANSKNAKLRQENNDLIKENKNLKAKVLELQEAIAATAKTVSQKTTKKDSNSKEETKNDNSSVSSTKS